MPTLRTLPEALAEGAGCEVGFTFIGEGGIRTRSYDEIRQSAHSVAGGLLAAGLQRGDVVALVISDAEQFLTTLIGAAIAGVVPASLYPPSTTAEIGRFFEATAPALADCGARALVTTQALVAGFEALIPTHPKLEAILSRESLEAAPSGESWRPALDDVAFIQYTSGSTSSPKGVVVTHRGLASNIEGIYGQSGLAVTSADRAVSWLPLYHDMGLVGMSLGALYGLLPAVLIAPEIFVKRPVEWLRAITRYRATVSYAPNFAYDLCVRRVKERDLAGLDLSSWRVAGCGAEPVNARTLQAFADKFAGAGFRATSFLPSYGLAEHVLAATIGVRGRMPRVETVRADDLAERRQAVLAPSTDESALRLVSCGRPLSGHALRIVREDGSEAGVHEVGEITLAGPSVMLGYYNNPDLTSRVIRDGWLHTGDLGYLSDGELFVCGRLKDLIVINGRKYHPQDLEWSVESVSGVKRGRVVAFATEPVEGPTGVIIVAEPSGTVAAASLTAEIRRVVGDLFGLAVGEVVLVGGGRIGRTTSGKVRRAAVRASYERGELGATGNPAGLHA
jgi:fatty-acyl-CoA synthase